MCMNYNCSIFNEKFGKIDDLRNLFRFFEGEIFAKSHPKITCFISVVDPEAGPNWTGRAGRSI